MWPKFYRDYPVDESLNQQQVEPGKGIVGCEMHDLNGWGESCHIPKKRKKGLLRSLFVSIFGKRKRKSL
ncbi:MAG: hypothetical protein K940chlam7_00958 [Chlamydiae bacterium]|nr:hypothetical protein [Chlamydiota bacterium]